MKGLGLVEDCGVDVYILQLSYSPPPVFLPTCKVRHESSKVQAPRGEVSGLVEDCGVDMYILQSSYHPPPVFLPNCEVGCESSKVQAPRGKV